MISRLMYGEKRLENLLVDSRKLHPGAIPQLAGAERQLTIEATSKPVQLEVDFSKP